MHIDQDYKSTHRVEAKQVLQELASKAKDEAELLLPATSIYNDEELLVQASRLRTAKKLISRFYSAIRKFVSRKKTK